MVSRSTFILSVLTLAGCTSSVWTGGYEIRTLGKGGDSGQRIQIADVELDLSVSPLSKYQTNIDVKALVRNSGTTQVMLTSEGARLVAESQSWRPVVWKAIESADGPEQLRALPPPVADMPGSAPPPQTGYPAEVERPMIVAPMQERTLLCAFEIGQGRRFPRNLLLTIGSVYSTGEPVDVG